MGNSRGLPGLRAAAPADHDAIADIWHSSASLPGVGPAVMPSRDELRQRVDVGFADGWDVTVAEADGELIGFLAIKPRDAILDELFIRPGFLGRGSGRALLAVAMEKMPGGFTLYTRASNAPARAFYEKAGLTFLREDLHPRNRDPIVHYGWKQLS